MGLCAQLTPETSISHAANCSPRLADWVNTTGVHVIVTAYRVILTCSKGLSGEVDYTQFKMADDLDVEDLLEAPFKKGNERVSYWLKKLKCLGDISST